MDEDTAEQITGAIDGIISAIAPTTGRRKMYGGFMFETELNNPKTGICGHFVYKHHVSLEFSYGHLLNDPDGLLEGKGKFRRHLKLRSLDDIQHKQVRSFLTAAFEKGTGE